MEHLLLEALRIGFRTIKISVRAEHRHRIIEKGEEERGRALFSKLNKRTERDRFGG